MTSRVHRRLPVAAAAAGLGAALAAAYVGALWAWDRPPGPPDIRPGPPDAVNVVLMVWDTTRADHLGPWGYDRDTTPALDALAEDGVVFEHARSPAPWTLPSHASLFTGLPPRRHGATWAPFDRGMDAAPPALPAERVLAARLARAGYQTVGVSSNPWVSREMGFSLGFDVFAHAWDHEPPQVLRALGLGAHGPAEASWYAFTRATAETGLREPFFLFWNVIDPHLPLEAPEPERFGGDPAVVAAAGEDLERRLLAGATSLPEGALDGLYDAELHYTDARLAELVAWLRAQGAYDDTMIVVTSDHGEHLGERGLYSHQLSVGEELLRVPLVVKWPRSRGRGGRDPSRTVSSLDVYASILREAGVVDDLGDSLPLQEGGGRRPFALSEYDWSTEYLRALATLSPSFDVEAHRVARYVVASESARVEFAGARVVDARTWDGRSAEDDEIRAAAAVLEAHLATEGAPEEGRSAAPREDVNTLLRELGYVGD